MLVLPDAPTAAEERVDQGGQRTTIPSLPDATDDNSHVECEVLHVTNTECFVQDTPYLSHIIKEIEMERSEREDLNSMVIKRPASTK